MQGYAISDTPGWSLPIAWVPGHRHADGVPKGHCPLWGRPMHSLDVVIKAAQVLHINVSCVRHGKGCHRVMDTCTIYRIGA